MPRRHCKTCGNPLHPDDTQAEYVSRLGKSHANAALSGADCLLQVKMLANEEAGLDSASLRDQRSATDLALRATKATAQAIGRSMSSLIVLERHLWLMMKEMKETGKVPFLHAPVSSGSLFGPAVEGSEVVSVPTLPH